MPRSGAIWKDRILTTPSGMGGILSAIQSCAEPISSGLSYRIFRNAQNSTFCDMNVPFTEASSKSLTDLAEHGACGRTAAAADTCKCRGDNHSQRHTSRGTFTICSILPEILTILHLFPRADFPVPFLRNRGSDHHVHHPAADLQTPRYSHDGLRGRHLQSGHGAAAYRGERAYLQVREKKSFDKPDVETAASTTMTQKERKAYRKDKSVPRSSGSADRLAQGEGRDSYASFRSQTFHSELTGGEKFNQVGAPSPSLMVSTNMIFNVTAPRLENSLPGMAAASSSATGSSTMIAVAPVASRWNLAQWTRTAHFF